MQHRSLVPALAATNLKRYMRLDRVGGAKGSMNKATNTIDDRATQYSNP